MHPQGVNHTQEGHYHPFGEAINRGAKGAMLEICRRFCEVHLSIGHPSSKGNGVGQKVNDG
jgi:hypothetical protein